MSRWEKSHTRNNLFAPFMKSSPLNIEDSLEYALEIFQDFNFLRQDKLFSNMDIIIFPNTAIPIGEGLLALKYFLLTSKRSQEKTASPKWFRVNTQFFSFGDTSWLTTFLLSVDPWWSTEYERENSNFLFVLRSWCDEFYIFLLFTCSLRWKNVSFISEPWVTSKTRAYGNMTLTKCLSYIIIMIIIILILLIINIIINNINYNINNNNNV